MKQKCLIIAKYLFTFIFLIIIYNLLLLSIALFPSELIYDQCINSLKEFELEGNMYYMSFWEQTDNFTDALIVNEAYSFDNEKPVSSYLRVRKNYKKGLTKYKLPDTKNDLVTYGQNTIENGTPQSDEEFDIVKEFSNFMDGKVHISVDYARYWHGYLILYRPLLLFLDIIGIRTFQLILLFILFVWVRI